MTMFFSLSFNDCNADIIKLKRGVSFEGKIVEEKEDVYLVELSIGVVEFKKSEVEEIEVYSEIDNFEMTQDWEVSEPSEEDAKEEEKKYDKDSLLNQEIDEEKPIKYKGKYITPEVYEIIKRDQEVQTRRYKYLQEKKRKASEERKAEEKKEEIISKKNEKKETAAAADNRISTFGSKETKKYGGDSKSTGDSIYKQKDVYKPFTGDEYEFFDNDNTL